MKKSTSSDTTKTTTPEADGAPCPPASPPPPHSVTEIPGLGPIRVRALQKAGLGDVKTLRTAGLERLIEVPGMSEIKARYIQDYLTKFGDDSESMAAPAPDTRARAPRSNQDDSMSPDSAQKLQTLRSCLDHEAAWCVGAIERVVLLLMSEPASAYRGRMLRGLARFLYAVRLVMDRRLLTQRQQERARKQVEAVIDLLPTAEEARSLDRKEQAEVADRLLRTSDSLIEIASKASARAASSSDAVKHDPEPASPRSSESVVPEPLDDAGATGE